VHDAEKELLMQVNGTLQSVRQTMEMVNNELSRRRNWMEETERRVTKIETKMEK